jgi:hypothetical protein
MPAHLLDCAHRPTSKDGILGVVTLAPPRKLRRPADCGDKASASFCPVLAGGIRYRHYMKDAMLHLWCWVGRLHGKGGTMLTQPTELVPTQGDLPRRIRVFSLYPLGASLSAAN